MKDYLFICDGEITYARRLSEHISNREEFDFEIRTFSSAISFASSINDMQNAIIICDEKFLNELLELEFDKATNVKTAIILLRERDNTVPEQAIFTNAFQIYKYQAVSAIESIIINSVSEAHGSAGNMASALSVDRLRDIKLSVKNRVQESLLISGEVSDNETIKIIDEYIDNDYCELCESQKRQIRNAVFYSIRGLDVLEEFISDDSITEIMVNGENNIFYEKDGRLLYSGKSFDSRQQLIDIIQKIVSEANRTVNMSSPIVDARLPDGSRVNAVLSPVSVDGPTLTIRRFPTEPLTAQKLISMGAVSEEIMLFLQKLVYSGYNLLISGCTGSGKTTFLNIMTSYIPKDERIITIEDSAELKIQGIKNLVRLEARNSNVDGCSEITIRDLIKTALRMRPDRVIIGESRGAEAIDMIQAFSVGQDGSMSTIHANNAEDAVYRLEMLMMLGGIDMPLNAIRRQIAMGVDIIIHLGRLKDKSRKLLEIREVVGIENGNITTALLYQYDGGSFVKRDELKNRYKLEKAGAC